MNPDLSGRCALVTGASRNLGPDIARALAARGARVAVNHRDSDADAQRVAAVLPGPGDHMTVAADVTDADAVERMVETVAERFGAVDILVNNAGPYGATPLAEAGEPEWDRVIDTNLKAAWLCSRAVAPHMRQRGWGRIINISAVSGHVRNRGSYGLAKAAMEVLTEELAWEMGSFATVNAVSPGQIDESLPDLAAVAPGWAKEVLKRTPRRRLVTRAEVGEVIALLCGEAFESMTATTLHLDGGLRLGAL